MKLFLCLTIIWSCAQAFGQPVQQNLGGKNWNFREKASLLWRPATVPGTVHTDLMAAKAIPDPFYRDNERKVQWISNLDWEYKLEFIPDPMVSAKPAIDLVFEGLDTYATVFLNDSLILSTSNMFLQHRIEVKRLLKQGSNQVRVLFRSPIKGALSDLLDNPQTLTATSDAMPLNTSPYTRKAGYHFGWDWGPRLVTSGIWRPVYLEGHDHTTIDQVFLETKSISRKYANISGRYRISNPSEGMLLKVQFGDLVRRFPLKTNRKAVEDSFSLTIPDPAIWWSNGLGAQPLYPVKVEIVRKSEVLDFKSFRFGIRTIDVVHKPDADGKSLYVKLNGKPVFMKGSNYIPQDNFLNRVGEDEYRQLLLSARDANLNMLRVWGGGAYESDRFYQLCDSLGLLVWQDFMFACALYPGTDSFRKSVEEEVRQNVRRLRNHPSIALWCGNNENETAWFRKWITGGMPLGRSDSLVVRQDMKNLFHNWIPSVLRQEDPNRFYTRSSPSANDDAIAPEKKGFGDAHDWHVWFASGDYRQYANTVSRFQSEYGYQSFPAMSTIRQFSFETDWQEDSEIMDVHQKHPGGTSKIKKFASRFYPKARNFNDFVYISQLQQAEAMRFAIETHRSSMPYCMGTLFWQLNDCWPAVSWSSIDYSGTWKACHYFVKKANEGFQVVARVQNDTVRVSMVNETMEPILAHTLEVKWLQFDGKVLFSNSLPLGKEALVGSMKVNKVKIGLLKGTTSMMDTSSTVVVISVLDNKGNLLSKDLQYLTVPKHMSLDRAQLKSEFRKIPGGFRLELSSKTLVKNLMITCDDPTVQFSDNYFDLLPGEQIGIECRGLIEPELKYFAFRCLNDIIRENP